MIGAGTKNIYSGIAELGGIGDAFLSQGLANRQSKNSAIDTSDVFNQYNRQTQYTNQNNQYNQIDASNTWGYYG